MGIRTILQRRGIHPADYRETVAAYVAAGLPEQSARRAALRSLDERRGTSKKRQPMPNDIPAPEGADDMAQLAAIAIGEIVDELAKRYPTTAKVIGRLLAGEEVEPAEQRRALRTAAYTAGIVADRLPEPIRTTARRMAAARRA